MTKKHLKNILLFIVTFILFYIPAFCQTQGVETIYFRSNSFSIDRKYEKKLNAIAKQLSSNRFGYLKIFGFANTKGPEDHNDVLSEKRANAVYNYLTAHANFDTSRVYVTWLGESADIYDLHFPGAHKQQRCVDIWIQFYDKKPVKPK